MDAALVTILVSGAPECCDGRGSSEALVTWLKQLSELCVLYAVMDVFLVTILVSGVPVCCGGGGPSEALVLTL
eukprot:1151234-Pelagomonas_calceolata.AAC.7